jgi:Asp-tRNA(Asn)/Glu-tRNA(Gln) amidotransferase C subunit
MNATICTQCRAALLLQRKMARRAVQGPTHATNPAVAASPLQAQRPGQFGSWPARGTSSAVTSSPDLRPPGGERKATPSEILAEPTWSVRSLLPPSQGFGAAGSAAQQGGGGGDEISPSTLRHLLRLSALPPPASEDEESRLLETLRSQLHFVRSIRSIDTSSVAPLVSIRDETAAGVREQTIGLAALEEALAREDVIGHNRRPRRRREYGVTTGKAQKKEQIKGVEDWDVLKGASETVGRYFVVRSGPGT